MAAGMSCVVSTVLLCILLAVVTEEYTPSRRLITYLNPNCTEECEGGLAYVKAKGDKDTLHFLITTVGTPTALVVRTNSITLTSDEDDTLEIDWNKLKLGSSGAIYPSNKHMKILYSYGISFTRLFQYDDSGDKADLSKYTQPGTTLTVFDFTKDKTTWQNLVDHSSDYQIVLKVAQTDPTQSTVISNGSLTIQFHMFDHADRGDDLPHLEYSEDTSQFDFVLHDIDTGNMTSARYGVEAIFFSNDGDKDTMVMDTIKSVDDEYSAGVFSMINWLGRPQNKAEGGYLQYKPICYMKPDRGRGVATSVKKYGPNTVTTDNQNLMQFVDNSIIYGFYGEDTKTLKMSVANFSFGLGKDGFFKKNNYTVWTGSIGYGVPPEDKVSTLVISVISAGLGVPVVLIIFGGLFVCIKKRSDKPSGVVNTFANHSIN